MWLSGIDRMLLFRDRLRRNDADRDLYGRTRSAGQRDWKYVQNYADAKALVIEEIIARAGQLGGEGNPRSVGRGSSERDVLDRDRTRRRARMS